eukprot:scaffold106799_cov18-Prasinocladus_malaysianus.AAC.1
MADRRHRLDAQVVAGGEWMAPAARVAELRANGGWGGTGGLISMPGESHVPCTPYGPSRQPHIYFDCRS